MFTLFLFTPRQAELCIFFSLASITLATQIVDSDGFSRILRCSMQIGCSVHAFGASGLERLNAQVT